MGKNKSITEGLCIEACTHSQHLGSTLGFVFPSSHTVRRQSIKRGEPRQMPSLPHTAESTVREEHFSSRRVSSRLALGGPEGCLGGLLRCKDARHVAHKSTCYQSPYFITIKVFCSTNLIFGMSRFNAKVSSMQRGGCCSRDSCGQSSPLQLRKTMMPRAAVPLLPPAPI